MTLNMQKTRDLLAASTYATRPGQDFASKLTIAFVARTEVRLCLSSLASEIPAVLLDLTSTSLLSAFFPSCKPVMLKEQMQPLGSQWKAEGRSAALTHWVHVPACTRSSAWAQSRASQTNPGSQKCLLGIKSLTYLSH